MNNITSILHKLSAAQPLRVTDSGAILNCMNKPVQLYPYAANIFPIPHAGSGVLTAQELCQALSMLSLYHNLALRVCALIPADSQDQKAQDIKDILVALDYLPMSQPTPDVQTDEPPPT